MTPALRRRVSRVVTGLICAVPLAGPVGCAHVVAGSPSYAPETPSGGMPLVKVAELPSLLLSPADISAVMKSPFDTKGTQIARCGTLAPRESSPSWRRRPRPQ